MILRPSQTVATAAAAMPTGGVASSTLMLLAVMVLTNASYLVPVTGMSFENIPRCGDCFCITDEDYSNVCPSVTVEDGIADTFTSKDAELYSSFVLTNPDENFLKLKSVNGGECYPFVDDDDDETAAAPIYPEAERTACVKPGDNDDSIDDDEAVCAYVFDPASTQCMGRNYEIRTFASEEEAFSAAIVNDGKTVSIVHAGPCGACSSAQDFGARMATSKTMEPESIKCATTYTFTQDFGALTDCFAALGFSEGCATLWAHFGATNSKVCAGDCIPTDTGVVLNGPGPECEPSPCLECQMDFRDDFDDLAGLRLNKAGITERIPVDCDDFYYVTHDPCVGIEGGGDTGGTNDEEEQPPPPMEEEGGVESGKGGDSEDSSAASNTKRGLFDITAYYGNGGNLQNLGYAILLATTLLVAIVGTVAM